jgi:hypothetical protein
MRRSAPGGLGAAAGSHGRSSPARSRTARPRPPGTVDGTGGPAAGCQVDVEGSGLHCGVMRRLPVPARTSTGLGMLPALASIVLAQRRMTHGLTGSVDD